MSKSDGTEVPPETTPPTGGTGGQKGADDLDISTLNQRFPPLSLAQELSAVIEKSPLSERLSRFREIPPGLRMYVFWYFSPSTQTAIVRTGLRDMARRYPSQRAVIASLERKYMALLPLFEKVRTTGRMSGNVARAFKDSLKGDEKAVAAQIGDELFPGSLYLIYPTEAEISPAGWQMLAQMAGTSPAAARFLALQGTSSRSSSDQFSPEDITDGFFIVRAEIVRAASGCVCNSNSECSGGWTKKAVCHTGGCYNHGHRQCSWWFWWIYCDGLCGGVA
ncbi:hypothetical protein [Chloracidobacterium thermophilum]|uniref:hypothetical protein n=1 Tax=Chloracidobacterium thermophilum TaxID=458033 RepID=UPI0007399FA9|nr:hypothetical protein [Chloracidobacterium thermophilum]